MSNTEPLGLIAGEGIFPVLVARGARAAGRRVVACGLGGCAWPELRDEVDVFRWVGIVRLGQWIRILKAEGCSQVILVGKVPKERIYHRWRLFRYIPDLRTITIWFRDLHRDKSDQAVLKAIDRELASEGIALIDSTTYCTEHLATEGVMTRCTPSEKQWDDIRYGWDLCQTISQSDIGQSIAVVDKSVIAVEAVEGTNAMIDRAGQLCKVGGWTLIKVANIRRDLRLDVPTVGTTTIERLHANRATALVLEPGKTIILEKTKVLELADRYRISIVGYVANNK
ncbi:MAG: UDP-2,3-diacylglucosamine diphosphatase LpxI [Tepidisphaeraceae bacterium]